MKVNAFAQLGLSEQMLAAVNAKGFEEPSEIQVMTIPVMLKNESNIIAQAQTGTGKTAAFGLPLIELLNSKDDAVQALVLVPTRELAIQVAEEINSLKGDKVVRVVPIYGGQSIDQQLRRLKTGAHIVVGTPGRIIDHIKRRTLKLGGIAHLILDEADEMLNMGFIDDIEEIMQHTNPKKRTLLFSATMPARIRELAQKYMDGYEHLVVKKTQLTTNLTEQIYFEVKEPERIDALSRIVDVEENFYGLVFCRTKRDVDDLVASLLARGYDAEAIHGDISQQQRERTLDRFKQKFINILVATDVAARGIDVNNLTHVINYALPQDPESYVHRIGRTGRAGKEGTAITFISPSEYKRLMFIQRIVKTDIRKSELPDAKEIVHAKRTRIEDELAARRLNVIDGKFYEWAKALLTDNSPTEVLAAVLCHCFEEELDEDSYGEISAPSGRQSAIKLEESGKARIFIALGKKDRMTPKKISGMIAGRVSIKSKQIGDIQVMDCFSFATVPFDKAENIVESFKEKGKRALVTMANK
ncbi:MAG: DEAD/DEAH box helicase [Phycisphaerae bacterium]|jgi:ATP-dependent RNA helicase DeaD